MKFEGSTLGDVSPKDKEKKKTPEEIAELEKSRTLSDATFLRNGAFYTINDKGEKKLNPLPEHIEHWRKVMEEELKYKGLSEDEIDRAKHEKLKKNKELWEKCGEILDLNKKIFHEKDKYKQKDGFIKNYVDLQKIYDNKDIDDELKRVCLDEIREIKGYLGEKEFERLLLIEQTIEKQEKEDPAFKL